MEIEPGDKGAHFSVDVRIEASKAWAVANEVVQQLSSPRYVITYTPPEKGGPFWRRQA